jgi:uncharacterized membrane protein YphA (DoxX/SURF4 family)
VLTSGGLLICGGLSVLTGVKPREGVAALVAFLVPVSLQMHRFWEMDEPAERQAELINFSKNMALAGAALMLLEIPEPWPLSLERTYDRVAHRTVELLPGNQFDDAIPSLGAMRAQ